VNVLLENMNWLEVAGVAQSVQNLGQREQLIKYMCNWLCFSSRGFCDDDAEMRITTAFCQLDNIMHSELTSWCNYSTA